MSKPTDIFENIDREANEEFVNTLLDLFEQRDEVVNVYTDQLLDIIRPNILSAFIDVLELPEPNIKWLDVSFELDEREIFFLVLTFQVEYYNQQANGYIKNNFGIGDADEEENVRMITFGIPAILVHLPKNDVIAFIKEKEAVSYDIGEYETADNEPEPKYKFDLSALDTIQQLQAKLFTKGTIH